jgi:hypothetical protein
MNLKTNSPTKKKSTKKRNTILSLGCPEGHSEDPLVLCYRTEKLSEAKLQETLDIVKCLRLPGKLIINQFINNTYENRSQSKVISKSTKS